MLYVYHLCGVCVCIFGHEDRRLPAAPGHESFLEDECRRIRENWWFLLRISQECADVCLHESKCGVIEISTLSIRFLPSWSNEHLFLKPLASANPNTGCVETSMLCPPLSFRGFISPGRDQHGHTRSLSLEATEGQGLTAQHKRSRWGARTRTLPLE